MEKAYTSGVEENSMNSCFVSGLFRSMSRVLSNGVVALLILVMGLLTAAWWGFAMQEPAFVQVRFRFMTPQ
jgi:hypothetical protein